MSLELSRSYSSTDIRRGGLGRGWSLSYDMGIERDSDNRILVRTENEFRVPFDVNPETNAITAPPGIQSTLTRAEDGYALIRRNGNTIQFEQRRPCRGAG